MKTNQKQNKKLNERLKTSRLDKLKDIKFTSGKEELV